MAELLKYIYNDSFFETYAAALEEVVPDFDRKGFLAYFATPHWAALELKQRMAYLAFVTQKWLPREFRDKAASVLSLISALRIKGIREQNLEYIFLADIIGESGIGDPEESLGVIEKVTAFTSFEFAVRPFILKYPALMMKQMLLWAGHPDANVRRFASEGCRPRLPWGLQLRAFVQDPSPILPILEKLRDDPSDYVLKSVGNNLNDISRDHPVIVRELIAAWKGKSSRTDRMLRQAARTLLKAGDAQTLALFGHHGSVSYTMDGFVAGKQEVPIGESLEFEFCLINNEDKKTDFRVEYYVWFVKSGGRYSKKIFKICDKTLEPGEKASWRKRHMFADLTTRRHFAGRHKISIVINGNESEALEFEVVPARHKETMILT